MPKLFLEDGSSTRISAIDITGQRFGRLVAVKPLRRGKHRQIVWLWTCDCGKLVEQISNEVKYGHKNSCGCRAGGLKDDSAFNSVYAWYSSAAKKRGLDFQLTKFEFRLLTSGDCYYCGKSPNQIKKQRTSKNKYVYNGVDRVDNNMGYLVYNCVPCCRICNQSKMDFDVNTFLEWVDTIYNNIHSYGFSMKVGT